MRQVIGFSEVEISPALLFDAVTTGRHAGLARVIGEYVEVLGMPGAKWNGDLESTDVVVVRALGEGQLGWLQSREQARDWTDTIGRVRPDRLVVRFREAESTSPDSTVADTYVQAHGTRFCVPPAKSGSCKGLADPRPVRQVVIHVLAVPSTSKRTGAQAVIAGWQKKGRVSAAHYIIDRDGTTTQMVREAHVAFHTPGGNKDSIGIEHADVCNDPTPFTTAMYEKSASLVRDIASRHSFTLDRTSVRGHVEVSPEHGDPGPYWDWDYYMRLLNWDGSTVTSRPVRVVARAGDQPAPPSGWKKRDRRAIKNSHCARRTDPYGPHYWVASKSASETAALLTLELPEKGRYQISGWWPKISGASEAAPVSVILGGTAVITTSLNLKKNYGGWREIGHLEITSAPAVITCRFARDSAVKGDLICDSVRALRV